MDIVTGDDGVTRCVWGGSTPDYAAYHDTEWGFGVSDDHRLFEKICLEGFQSGLSWLTILRKRENFRAAFDGFDIDRVAGFGEHDVERLLGDAGIVRHQGKIRSTINNAQRALELIDEHGSMAAFFWPHATFTDQPVTEVPALTETSTMLSKQLKRAGWSFVGPTTMYASCRRWGWSTTTPQAASPGRPRRPRDERSHVGSGSTSRDRTGVPRVARRRPGIETSRFERSGTTVCPAEHRRCSSVVSHYRIGEHSVLWCDPALAGRLDRFDGADDTVEHAAFGEWAIADGAELVGAGFEHVLPAVWTAPEHVAARLDARHAADVGRVAELLDACGDDDVDDAEFDVDALDPFLVGRSDGDTLVALAGARPWDQRPRLHDIGVIVHPHRVGRGSVRRWSRRSPPT